MVNILSYHVPVLLTESVDGLAIQPNGFYIDVTLGGGGHTNEILRRLGPEGHLYGFDQDADAMKNAPEDKRFTFVRSNFRYLKQWMRYYGVEAVDGILADLGVSSHHLDEAERGFSFRFDAPLDMRMNQRATLSAEQVVNTYSEQQLSDVLYLYGEIRNARQVAAAIVKARQAKPISTTTQLLEATERLFAREREKKEVTKMFQALRIEVNREMEALRQMLNAACQVLKPGGRLSIITYHSLEDRMVKNVMRTGNAEGQARQDFFGRTEAPLRPVGKVITPSAEEQQSNPRSRSAKLRVAEKEERSEK
ncbi:MAG: 16S rRNA (cytosine(1402)-N(4))-methyltransferase RsmH [Prevotella sp.]|nr:16S rRNA (cytosine(1402)-N(4))-methyltransferase RsmH [Prevotella sp.]